MSSSGKSSNMKTKNSTFKMPVRISFLGGLNEIGKNMTLYEYDGDMFIVDCGLAFPESDMLGVDLVIPDFTYVQRNADKIKGVVITHGHEDHIGGLAYLLKVVNVPVYATPLTIGLIQGKLREHDMLDACDLRTIKPGDRIKLGKFELEAIHVNHSIPDALAFAIRCEAGTIIQTGDFKIDTTPIDGQMIDLARFAEIGKEGVLCYLADSTNAEKPGYSASEMTVGQSFETLFRLAGKRRIIVATFASNIHRVQQIMNEAITNGRKVALSGRSLENVIAVGKELGYLEVPDDLIIPLDEIGNYEPWQILLVTTGSQGEPMSALSRMAFQDHKKVNISSNDFVIISATPIPGNEKSVSKVVNELMRHGAEVVYEKMYDVHVSGHASQEELKLMLALIKPRYFIPVHGEQKHLTKHAMLANHMGMATRDIIIAEVGKTVEVCDGVFHEKGVVPAGKVFVDGSGVGDVGQVVLRDRTKLSQDGIITVVLTIDSASGEIVAGPDIVSRGFVYVRESEEIMDEMKRAAFDAAEDCIENDIRDWASIKSSIRDSVGQLVYERTRRSPMILPIIMEV
ncbi:MAG: ribonuclease J [Oscillospiraceae bacterium]|nr:ribonuclease J [Candidatus Limimonas coprohippi]MCQ2488122.1 ribonuclease J [Clostridia bacterium]